MPRMKWGADLDELPMEWEESDFEPYDGPLPPANKLLNGEVKKMWAAVSEAGNDMLIALFEASGNTGDKAQYNGWSTFARIALTPKMAWQYGPLLEALGITLQDVHKKTVVAEEDDNVGTPIRKIGTLKFPKACSVVTKRETYEGERQAKAGKFAAVTKKAKARSRRASQDDDDLEDDDVPF